MANRQTYLMKKIIAVLFSLFFISASLCAQTPASKEQQELEKQRQQLKKELVDKKLFVLANDPQKTYTETVKTLCHLTWILVRSTILF